MEKYIDFNIAELQEGAVQEKIEKEVERIMSNVLDLDTDATKKRKLTITIDFTPDENRQVIGIDAQVKSTVAPQVSVGTTMLAGRNMDTGFIEARELNSGTPGQTFIDDSGDLKTDVGDPIDDEGNIIDFNKNRQSN